MSFMGALAKSKQREIFFVARKYLYEVQIFVENPGIFDKSELGRRP